MVKKENNYFFYYLTIRLNDVNLTNANGENLPRLNLLHPYNYLMYGLQKVNVQPKLRPIF